MVDFKNIKGHDNEGQLKNNQKRGISELSDEAKADVRKLEIIWSYLDMQDNALKEGELITVILDEGLSVDIDSIIFRIRNQINTFILEAFKEDAK